MVKDFEAGGAWIDKIYYCPHHPEFGSPPYRKDCDCRKPKAGMIEQAQRELDVDLSRSFMIGDKSSDIEFGKNGGLQTILVLTGYGQEEYDHQRHQWKFDPDFFADNILEAAKLIRKLIRMSH
jgi:D-glycero-D-manno-heptose 1,7-bisphosphate phosphatase